MHLDQYQGFGTCGPAVNWLNMLSAEDTEPVLLFSS